MNSSQLPDAHLISKLQTLAKAASFFAIIVGCLVFVGWSFDIVFFKSVIPGLASMKANTAFCFFCSGISLLSQQPKVKLRRHIFKLEKFCAMVVIAIASLTLAQYLFNWDFGIDQLLFQDTAARVGNHPGRMAPNTAINFILISLALLLLPQKSRRYYQIVQLCVLIASLISGLALIGYAYDVKSLYQINSYTSLALHTSVTFIVICLGILLTQPERGMLKIITSRNMGGLLARRLLIAAIALPFGLGWLIHKGQEMGFYSNSFSLSLLIMTNISIFVVLIWQNAKVLARLDEHRQQVEDELQETLATLQALIQASPLAIITLDAEKKLKLWSPAAESIFGWSESEVLGSFVPFVPNDQLAEFQRLHQFELQGSTITHAEVQWQKKDGELIDVAVWVAPLPDAHGNINSTMAVIADITERKRILESLKASEEQFRQLAENIRDVFWTIDLHQQQLLYVSPAYEKIWGRSCASLLGNAQNWLATIHPDDRQSLEDSFSARMNREDFADLSWSEFERTYRIVRPEGTVRWIRDRGFPIKNEQGEVYRIAGIAEDITERKSTEEELRETTQTLQALIQACPLGITVFSLDDGKVKLWNPAAETIFGWSEYEVLAHFLPTVPEDKQEDFLANLESVRQGNQLAGIEVQRQKKGGVPIDINVWAAPLIDAKGNVSCMSIVADISDRKRTEAERKRLLASEQAARSAAETANRLKDEFLAVLSHELRTPMNAILGWTHLLRTRKFEAAAIERALETIDRNSKSLSQLIEDVLDVSKVVRGKLQLNIRPVELDAVIEAAIETLQPTAQLKEIQIESWLDDSVGLVLGDGNRLQQVVWNLLSNAVKFTPKGGRVEVHLSAVHGELAPANLPAGFIQEEVSGVAPSVETTHYVQIQVRDTGKGIAPEFLPHVFERFRQENSSTTRTYGGLGLGLAIVRHLVELHGGTVWVDSLGEGKGASFSVLLPIVPPVAELNQRSQSEYLSPFHSTHEQAVLRDDLLALTGLRVLVVDDEADARELVATMLRQYGVEVTEAASAVEGLAVLPRLMPNVLISDIGMPEQDGYSFMRQIRALPGNAGGAIPALALTAYAREEDQRNALSAGFNQHLPKPINPLQLVEMVANLAGRNWRV